MARANRAASGGRARNFTSVPPVDDTNVLLYADDRSDNRKRQRAEALIRDVVRDRNGGISLQVLQEFWMWSGWNRPTFSPRSIFIASTSSRSGTL
ncbi:MAG TPA: hypothetical protein VGQ46_04425 [Thermoanaerobaculia bacterium]|jgi:hypothetical protein|nr:hypothetical protein [Thermoanaerobaculia bacterium]